MTGRAHFNEIFFDDVHIGPGNVVGAVNEGWNAAVTTLLHERLSISSGVGMGGQRDNPPRSNPCGRSWTPQTRWCATSSSNCTCRSRALALFNAKLSQETKAGIFPGARGSAAKLLLAELVNSRPTSRSRWPAPRRSPTRVQAGWPGAIALAPAMSLGGGTNEIMRNIIGDRVLNLPPEPRVDKKVPFKDLKVGTQS